MRSQNPKLEKTRHEEIQKDLDAIISSLTIGLFFLASEYALSPLVSIFLREIGLNNFLKKICAPPQFQEFLETTVTAVRNSFPEKLRETDKMNDIIEWVKNAGETSAQFLPMLYVKKIFILNLKDLFQLYLAHDVFNNPFLEKQCLELPPSVSSLFNNLPFSTCMKKVNVALNSILKTSSSKVFDDPVKLNFNSPSDKISYQNLIKLSSQLAYAEKQRIRYCRSYISSFISSIIFYGLMQKTKANEKISKKIATFFNEQFLLQHEFAICVFSLLVKTAFFLTLISQTIMMLYHYLTVDPNELLRAGTVFELIAFFKLLTPNQLSISLQQWKRVWELFKVTADSSPSNHFVLQQVHKKSESVPTFLKATFEEKFVVETRFPVDFICQEPTKEITPAIKTKRRHSIPDIESTATSSVLVSLPTQIDFGDGYVYPPPTGANYVIVPIGDVGVQRDKPLARVTLYDLTGKSYQENVHRINFGMVAEKKPDIDEASLEIHCRAIETGNVKRCANKAGSGRAEFKSHPAGYCGNARFFATTIKQTKLPDGREVKLHIFDNYVRNAH